MSSEANTQLNLGYEHYVCFPNDGRRHEIIDGDHYVNPAPNPYHQAISGRLFYQLFDQIERKQEGRVYHAPTDLQLTDFDIVQPDLLVVLEARHTIITPTKIKGAPDLVIEIVSSTTEQHDRILKKDLYERTSVPEYWIVDPAEHFIEQYVLDDSGYGAPERHADTITSHRIDGVRIDLTRVW